MPDTPAQPPKIRDAFSLLGFPAFRNLLISNTLWWQAMRMEMLVIGWLVLEMTDSAWQVALVGFYRSIPLLITGFISGPLADRFGRIRLVLIAQGTSLVVVAMVTYLLWSGRIELWQLSVGAGIFGTCWSLNWTARRALIPDIVGKEHTVEAVLIESFSSNISRVMGPILGGTLLYAIGAPGGYAVVTIATILSFLMMLRVHPPTVMKLQSSNESPWRLMVDGLRYMRRSQPILGGLLITVAMNYLIFPYQTLMPVFARDVLGQGPVGLGLLEAANGIGAFAGLYVAHRLRPVLSRGWIFAAGSAFMATMLLGFSSSEFFNLSFTLLLLSGLGHGCFSVMQSSIVLLAAEDHMRDRAMGALILAIGTGPIGRLQIGALAEAHGAPVALALQASVAICLVLAIAASLPGFRKRLD